MDVIRGFSELTDQQWTTIEPLVPTPRSGGGRRTCDMRAIANGVLYRAVTGSSATPAHFPPRTTLNGYYQRWMWDHTVDQMVEALALEATFKPIAGRIAGGMQMEQVRQRTGFLRAVTRLSVIGRIVAVEIAPRAITDNRA
jgi:transposase